MLSPEHRGFFSDEFNFKSLGDDGLEAVVQLAQGEHHNLVPLVSIERRRELLADTSEKYVIDALAAFTIKQASEGGNTLDVDKLVVPPRGYSEEAFMEICVDLNRAVARPLQVEGSIFSAPVSNGTAIATGVAKYANVRNPDVAIPMLVVPRVYARYAPSHPDYDPQVFSTDVASAMFDSFASGTLEQNS